MCIVLSVSNTTSWSYDGRTALDNTYEYAEELETAFRYDVSKGANDWWEILVVPGYGLFSYSSIEHNPDTYDNFQQTIVERQSFVVKVPKTDSYFKVKLFADYEQMYFDYRWVNTVDISSETANSGVVKIYNYNK